MAKLSRLELENKVLKSAVKEYANPRNWDGCGGWIHPSYSTEFAELALMAIGELEMAGRKKRPRSLQLVKK
jgi:hypothetical protein